MTGESQPTDRDLQDWIAAVTANARGEATDPQQEIARRRAEAQDPALIEEARAWETLATLGERPAADEAPVDEMPDEVLEAAVLEQVAAGGSADADLFPPTEHAPAAGRRWGLALGIVAVAAALLLWVQTSASLGARDTGRDAAMAAMEQDPSTTTGGVAGERAARRSRRHTPASTAPTPPAEEQVPEPPEPELAEPELPEPPPSTLPPAPSTRTRARAPKAPPKPSASELLAAAQAQLAAGDRHGAIKAYEQLIDSHGGSREGTAALVSLGRLQLASQPSKALRAFDRYLARGGSLAAEAAYGRVRALRQLGRSTEADKAAAAFVRMYPSSLYAGRLRDELESK